MGETALELSVYWIVLRPGGVLAGDDWTWPSVKHDLLHFAALQGANIEFTHGKRTWYMVKPMVTL